MEGGRRGGLSPDFAETAAQRLQELISELKDVLQQDLPTPPSPTTTTITANGQMRDLTVSQWTAIRDMYMTEGALHKRKWMGWTSPAEV